MTLSTDINTTHSTWRTRSRNALLTALSFALAATILASCVAPDSLQSWAGVSHNDSADPLPQSEETQSAYGANAGQSLGHAQSDSAQSADVQMSGRFEVASNGKLVLPKSTPIPDPPVFTENMDFETQQGMREFTRYFFSAVEYARMTQNLEPLEKISTADCGWCALELGRAHLDKLHHGWIESFHVDITELHEPFKPELTVPVWNYHVNLKISPRTIYDGFRVSDYPEETLERVVVARRVHGEWRMVGVYSVKKD